MSTPIKITAGKITVAAELADTDLAFLREDLVALLRESQEGLDRVKKIVQDLKDFSHVDEKEWQWVDLHKGIDSTLIDRVTDESVTGEIKRDLVACSEECAAAVGRDTPFVGHFGCHEGDHATIMRLYGSLVEDGASTAARAEAVSACKKVAVGHVER